MIHSPSINDATGRTVDHSDVTVAAKPKARDDEPWLIATRNKKLRFAFAFASSGRGREGPPLSSSLEPPLHHALGDACTHAYANRYTRTWSSAYFH